MGLILHSGGHHLFPIATQGVQAQTMTRLKGAPQAFRDDNLPQAEI